MRVYGIVYSAFCNKSGKYYVGQTIGSLEKRILEHERDAASGKNKCLAFHSAINKHGKDSFSWSIVYTASSKDELNLAEISWIKILNSRYPAGYNIREGGDSGGKLHEESRRKISVAVTGNKSHLGYSHSEEVRKKISEKVRLWNSLHTRKLSQETIAKMSLAKKGKVFSLEHRLAISKSSKGRKRSPESIAKGALSNRHPRGPYKKRASQ